MLDFASALYLGIRHASGSLRPWGALTRGAPAALAAPSGAASAARRVARLQGCEAGILAPSTLHLFWDLFGILSKEKAAIYMDEGAYPIARWGVERAAARRTPVRIFRHYDAEALGWSLKEDVYRGLKPVVVFDGFCPGCSKGAPIADYIERVRSFGGILLVDDTQALGILGQAPGPDAPYGQGGGGTLRFGNISGPDLLVVSSMAKGFGVPVAILSGSHRMIEQFKEKSETRVHCSPPSAAVIHAAERAMEINYGVGDALRLRLVQLVRYFQDRLKEVGVSTRGGLFPVQTLLPPPDLDAGALHEGLLRQGIRTVLHRNRNGSKSQMSFILTVSHRLYEIEYAVNALVIEKKQNKSMEVTHGNRIHF